MATTSPSRPAVATITQAVFASGPDDARPLEWPVTSNSKPGVIACALSP